jgi:hypothetical protein
LREGLQDIWTSGGGMEQLSPYNSREASVQKQLTLIRTACPFFNSSHTIDLMIGQQHLIIDLAISTVLRSSLLDIVWGGKGASFVPNDITQKTTYTTEGKITLRTVAELF